MVTKSAFDAYAKTFGKSFKNRQLYVGASEIGLCMRKVWYDKHQHAGILPDSDYEDSYGAKHRGSVVEEAFWLPAMRMAYGPNLLYAGGRQKHFRVGNLSGAPDGLLTHQKRNALAHLFIKDIGASGEIVLDCKTIDPRARTQLNKPKHEHLYQMIVNIGLMREKSVHKPEYGLIAYINSSFFDDIIEFPVQFDPEIYENAKKRADAILEGDDIRDMRPEGWIAGGRECDYCPYQKACRAVRGAVPPEEEKPIPLQLAAELEDLARAQDLAGQQEDAAKIKRRDLEDQIKRRLQEKGLRIAYVNGTRIIWSSVKGRTSLDMNRVRAVCTEAGIDLSQYEIVGEPSDRLTVTVAARKPVVT